jgi:glutamate N-acetyltransferase/amino-acid N-acetyltransferase
LLRSGYAQRFDQQEVTRLLDGPEVLIRVSIKTGGASATAWGCDMSPEYVRLNSEYTT